MQQELISALQDRDFAMALPHFDAAFYRRQNPEIKGDDEELLRHFLATGWREGRDPSTEFSVRRYLEAYPEVARRGLNPLVHYIREGRAEGCLPKGPGPEDNPGTSVNGASPQTDIRAQSASNAPSTDASGQIPFSVESKAVLPASPRKRVLDEVAPHFDAQFYRVSYPEIANDVRARPMRSMTQSWQQGRPASAEFSARWYLTKYAGIASAGYNLLLHHLRGEDRALLSHYLTEGWREGRDPSPEFSTKWYLENNPDVAYAGINPLLHYIRHGRAEGRLPKPRKSISIPAPAAPPEPPPSDVEGRSGSDAPTSDVTAREEPPKVIEQAPKKARSAESPAALKRDLDTVAPYFDAAFYRKTYPEITGDDRALLLHYMTEGWREGRDPSTAFSTKWYLENYPDIAKGGLNPFLHFIIAGKREGRRPLPDGPVVLVKNLSATIVPDDLVSVLKTVSSRPLPDSGLPKPPEAVNCAALDIHWVIPDFSRGSGGHMTIFRMVRYLELFGHRCTIWIDTLTHHKSPAAAHDTIVKYFQCVGAQTRLLSDGFFAAQGDVLIATGWTTAFPVSRATGFAAKYYFVQDHEPEFYPAGSEAALARATYGLDLACICASPWLDRKLTKDYGRWARHFHLAYDNEHYRIHDAVSHAKRFDPVPEGAAAPPVRIAVYARNHSPRRCVPLALAALEILAARGIPIEVHFYGQSELPFSEAPFDAYNHGVLDAVDLSRLYNSCDIGICFSATNYSLVPQEMMACGLPVVELDGESTRAIFPEGVVTFAGPDPEDIADKLAALIADPDLRKRQMQAALTWVSGFSWEGAARKVEAAIISYLAHRRVAAPALIKPTEVLLDVVIPTYNGINEIKDVIDALRSQRGRETIQVHCIDSSSTDGTQDWLRAQSDINLRVIRKEEFQHGRTRNWGAAMGKAPIIAFLTQDAVPAADTWARDILMMFDHHKDAAGLFGRHMPYPHHPRFVREDINNHFQKMLKFPLALSKSTDPSRWASGDTQWRQFLHFYSDNNSAMRRRIWKEMPYPEVPYGEDQVWARGIIEAGHVKLYSPTAAVYHSHDYGPDETYERAKIESEFFFLHFGYRLGDGTPEQLDRRIAQEQEALRRKAQRGGLDPHEVERRLANIAAKHRGWRDGLAAGVAKASQAAR